jgi:serine protease Do
MIVEVRIGERESENAIANLNTRLWPGFSVFPLTDDLRSDIELEDSTSGVLVSTVENRTPGAAAGLRVGDIITRMDDRPVANLVDFYRLLNEGSRSIDLSVLRDGTVERLQLQR